MEKPGRREDCEVVFRDFLDPDLTSLEELPISLDLVVLLAPEFLERADVIQQRLHVGQCA